MKKSYSFILTILFVWISSSAFAWGAFGHRISGDIAKIYVYRNVLDSVQVYFENMKWADAAVWMDEVRSDHFYDYLKPMHYVNVEKGATYIENKDDNIINELNKVINELKNRRKLSKQKIVEDLKILFHLMGDLHQPLHVGYGIDRGGNIVDIDFFGDATNLHRVWDAQIIERQGTFKSDIIAMSKQLTSAEIKAQQKVDIKSWMNESRSYLPLVYDFKEGKIDETYVSKVVPTIEKQILYSGIRLAGVLNYIFSGQEAEIAYNDLQLSEPKLRNIEENNSSKGVISLDSAKYNVGSTVTICSKVTGVYVGKSGVVKLNFGGGYPNNSLTVVIFPNAVANFKKAEFYDGKVVCIVGKIQLYENKPEIIIKDASQLKVLSVSVPN